jgi:hypothetical protein
MWAMICLFVMSIDDDDDNDDDDEDDDDDDEEITRSILSWTNRFLIILYRCLSRC